VWNANSVKSKKSELANPLSISNLDPAPIDETQLAPKHIFPFTGYFVCRSDRDQFGGDVMLLVVHSSRHDQFVRCDETVAVCLYLQNNTLLLFVSCYTSDSQILHSDLNSVVSSFHSVVLVSDLNSKHTAWNCTRISVDRNGRTLLSYYPET
jgi:hypothetical protein